MFSRVRETLPARSRILNLVYSQDKPITLKVKVGDQEVNIEAKSRSELQEAEKIALNLIEALKDKS